MLDSHTAGIDLDAGFPYERDSPRYCISVPGGFTGLPVKAKIREKKWELEPGLRAENRKDCTNKIYQANHFFFLLHSEQIYS